MIEWRLACDGWVSRQRLGFVATTEEGQGFSHDVRFSSWEAIDGSRLQYTIRSYGDDGPQEDYRGEARLEPTRAAGSPASSTPQTQEVKLPPGTVFPTDHLQRVLAGARAGVRFLSHEVFDGWGFDALTQITSVIGQPRQDRAADEAIWPAPPGAPGRSAWPTTTSRIRPTRRSSRRASALSENGVLRDLVLDYGDFSLDATLEKLELLEPPAGLAAGLTSRSRQRLSEPASAGTGARLRPSQAAPRTPEESPCIGGSRRVRTVSEKT